MGSAVLQAWDDRREEVVDLEIEWDKGHDVDARVRVPKRYRELWKFTVKRLRRDHADGQPFAPYATLPISVPVEKLTKSTTGIYAVAQGAWTGDVGWRVPPPFPKAEKQDPEVSQ